MLSYYVIYYEKFIKVMQQTEKEASRKSLQQKCMIFSNLQI